MISSRLSSLDKDAHRSSPPGAKAKIRPSPVTLSFLSLGLIATPSIEACYSLHASLLISSPRRSRPFRLRQNTQTTLEEARRMPPLFPHTLNATHPLTSPWEQPKGASR